MPFDATPFFRLYARRRMTALARLDPIAAQRATLLRLVSRAAATAFGRLHDFAGIRTVEDYQRAVPLRRYEQFWREFWQPRFPVLDDCTWPGRIPFFALSSGTSSGTTKYIPVTRAMNRSNVRASLDLVSFHLSARPQSRAFAGKSFLLGGSTALHEEAPGVYSGDLSGIAAHTTPWWARPWTFPGRELALIADWESKLERLARAALDEDIRILTGTPSWLVILLEHMRALGGGRTAFPDLELLVHGGVSFAPYRHRFADLLGGCGAESREVYPASEAFVALADRADGEGLRVNVDHDVFFEFVPADTIDSPTPERHWVRNVESGVNYAVVVTNCAGLWSYVLGDTVRFVHRSPPRLLVTGRLSYGLSAFGEHLIGEEIEGAVAAAAQAINRDVDDWTVGVRFPDGDARGWHVYLVEFAGGAVVDEELTRFVTTLDARLQQANDDYRAHRTGDLQLGRPEVRAVPAATFAAWMKSRGKLGGQNKVPRVIHDEALWNGLLAFSAVRGDSR
jgi:hypothetical protein